MPLFYYLLTGAFFIEICKFIILLEYNKTPLLVKLLKLAEFLTKLAEYWELIGRGPLENFGNRVQTQSQKIWRSCVRCV